MYSIMLYHESFVMNILQTPQFNDKNNIIFKIFSKNIIGVGADALLVRPKDQMCAFIEGIPQDMADSRPSPGIIVGVKLRVGLDTGDGDFFFHQPFGNPHAAQPVKGIVIDFADDRRCLRVKDKMPFVLRVTHQTKRRRPAAELSPSGDGHHTL